MLTFLKRSALALLASGATALAGCALSHGAALPASGPTSARVAAPEPLLGTLSLPRSAAAAIRSDIAVVGTPRFYYGPWRNNVAQPVRGATVHPNAGNPLDLTYHGGYVVHRSVAYDIYINCPASCWGEPGSLSARLGDSAYIHVIDQYMRPDGNTANNRYTFGGGYRFNYDVSKPLTTQDIGAIIHAVAKHKGSGLERMYHVFVPKDVGLCTHVNPTCAVDFCGFHNSMKFNDIGWVVYSVEPFPGPGCFDQNLRDSVDTTLLHEIFETITDPFVNTIGLGWYNENKKPGTNADYGEIADYCDGVYDIDLGGVVERLQKIWSNSRQSCTFDP